MSAPVDFAGRIVMVGCGSIGQAILPLLRRQLSLGPEGLVVLAADEGGRGIAQDHGAQFIHAHLKPRSFRRILARYLRRGDLLLNLSVDVSSLDLITYASERGALYVDSSIEPWPGVFDNPMLDLRQRSNFTTRRRAMQLAAELGADSPTAVVDHGANPGLVSHFVKRALLELDRALRQGSSRPASREEWAVLARDLGVSLIQISELGAERAGMELRACIGADAARRAAERATPAQRAEVVARAEALAVAAAPDARNLEYEGLWDAIVEGAANVAYRLALNTLNTGQHLLVLDADEVSAELGDADAIRALAAAIATGEAETARALAADLLERSVPA